ncbi:MAG: hypothetical protein J7M21_05000 [Planctomycetes bacterium]|nr:hypothetical protein [Planctomycetota bacterium]
MNPIYVRCPSCKAKLAVPRDTVKRYIRCGRCRHKFLLAEQKQSVVDDVIASWLSDEQEEAAVPSVGESSSLISEESLVLHPEEAQSAAKGEFRVARADERRAIFEFPPSRLLESRFRMAFPRRCICCDSRTHLRAHVIIFAAELRDSVSLEKEHRAGGLVLSDKEVREMTDQQILERLQRVPGVPHPVDMPMPYWTCDMCSGVGTVAGEFLPGGKDGRGRCRLAVGNLRHALEFARSIGAEGSEGFDMLKERVAQMAADPWHNVPQVVQQRIQQWYHPKADEQFIAYIPDRDHNRTEDGLAGVLISNYRVIYHTQRRHHEARLGETLELEHSSQQGKHKVRIRAHGWEVRALSVDREGIQRFRRGLTLGRFNAIWT